MPDIPATPALVHKPVAPRRGARLGIGKSSPVSQASGKPRKRRSILNSEVDCTVDEAEFLAAIDKFKREKRRPFLTWSEVLEVLRGLGYRKVDVTGQPGSEGGAT